ncbi:MAG TPA: hypothetical protein VNN72_06970 [Polyangiaceae bacterium]|nr:hypothetical protein [Polyangiaceae bacterium]
MTDDEARTKILWWTDRAGSIGGFRRGIYMATNYGNGGHPLHAGAYRFVREADASGLDEVLRERFAAVLSGFPEQPEQTAEERAQRGAGLRELVAALEAG